MYDKINFFLASESRREKSGLICVEIRRKRDLLGIELLTNTIGLISSLTGKQVVPLRERDAPKSDSVLSICKKKKKQVQFVSATTLHAARYFFFSQ